MDRPLSVADQCLVDGFRSLEAIDQRTFTVTEDEANNGLTIGETFDGVLVVAPDVNEQTDLGLDYRFSAWVDVEKPDDPQIESQAKFSDGFTTWKVVHVERNAADPIVRYSVIEMPPTQSDILSTEVPQIALTTESGEVLTSEEANDTSLDGPSPLLLTGELDLPLAPSPPSTVLVTTNQNHKLSLGDSVIVSGAVHSYLNGAFTVTSVPSSTTFTYSVNRSGVEEILDTATIIAT